MRRRACVRGVSLIRQPPAEGPNRVEIRGASCNAVQWAAVAVSLAGAIAVAVAAAQKTGPDWTDVTWTGGVGNVFYRGKKGRSTV